MRKKFQLENSTNSLTHAVRHTIPDMVIQVCCLLVLERTRVPLVPGSLETEPLLALWVRIHEMQVVSLPFLVTYSNMYAADGSGNYKSKNNLLIDRYAGLNDLYTGHNGQAITTSRPRGLKWTKVK